MKRKSFLQRFTLLSATLGLSTKSLFPQTSSSIGKKRAIVLGGGLAGMYSAYLLQQTGYDITLIEKGQTLGGRIHTYENPESGIVQDLGGEWIGEGQTDIKSLVKQLGLSLLPSFINSHFSLDTLQNSFLSKSSRETLEKVIELHRSLGTNQKQGLDKINFHAYARYQGLTEEETKGLNDLFRPILGADLRFVSSEAVLDDLSALASALKPKYSIQGGAGKMVKALTERMRSVEILTSETATKVSQQKNQVTVDLASGKSIRGSLLICTLPVAAVLDLKWTPSLPKDLVYSALRMQTGRISKHLILTKNKRESFFTTTLTPLETLYLSNEAIGNDHSAVVTLTTGEKANLLERASDRQRNFLFQVSLEELGGYELTPSENPYIIHSFEKNTGRPGFVSVFPPGSYGIKDVWNEPFERTFFAGEHLALHTGSMDSAISSAIQAISKT